MKLTTKRLAALAKHKPSRAFEDFPDGTGLICRIYKSGRMAWYSRYRFDKKAQIIKHGEYPAMGLKEARVLNNEIKEMISEGINPTDTGVEKGLTLSEGWNYWINNYAKHNRKDTTGIERMFGNHLSKQCGDREIESITKKEWISILNNINAPVTARTLYKTLSQVCRYLEAQDMIETNIIGKVPASFIGSKANVRDRVLNRSELKQFITDTGTTTKRNRKWHLTVMVIMLSGCRSHELREANISHFNFKEKIWTVPKTIAKEEEDIVRPITEHIEPMLRELIAMAGKNGNLYLTRNGEIVEPANFYGSCKRICKILDNPCSPHVFRHSLATHFSDLEIPPFIGERCLGHKMVGVLATYNKGRYLKQMTEALNKYHDWIIE